MTSGPEPPGGRLGHVDMRTKDWTGPETADESAKFPEKFHQILRTRDWRLDWTSGPEPPGGRLGHVDMRTKD